VLAGALVVALAVVAIAGLYEFRAGDLRRERADRQIDLLRPCIAAVPGLAPGPYLHLSVADDGPGIPATIQERIFEPFLTTKPPGQGTGLGLSVVHGIVADSGVVIRLTSTPGSGTRFDIHRPLHQGAPDSAAAPAAADAPVGRGQILFVDDELLIVRMGQRALGKLGYTVVGATDPDVALRTFAAAPGEFDLVITDQTMPGMTGEALIASLRQLAPGLPAILCTGYSPTINADEARTRGIEAFLMKPLEADDLGRAVARVLAAARPAAAVAAPALSP